MGMRTPPPAGCASATSAHLGRFEFLLPEEREPAQLSYEFFSSQLALRRVMPSRVWFDLDDTLIRWREGEIPEGEDRFIFQGAIVGAMFAFAQAGVDVGIFSFWKGVEIWDLIEEHSFLGKMLARDEAGVPLFRGVEYINKIARSLASPGLGVYAVLKKERKGATRSSTIYYDTQPVLTDAKRRAMKNIEAGEILFDNDPLSVYWKMGMHFAQGNLQRAEALPLVKAIELTARGYLELDDPSITSIPKYLSDAEKHLAIEIFNRLERGHG